ncbi:transporter associated domain-containing protein [Seminibacterium arietis]|uniref:Transporter associated domain-containing protein n=1 Tax=Seminibacterium arietis TaxID=1173502 RepID=A0ABW3IAF0_9PAST
MLDIFFDSSAVLGLVTLIVLEIILGIDNLVFIAILANKLPQHQRNKARTIGLSLALLMRLVLLSLMSWLITLTNPIFVYNNFSLSLRDIILLIGGLFLVFKATMELHERLENKPESHSSKVHAGFTAVVVQIVILDAVFSFDAVVTAVGMVQHLSIMMTAVIVAMALMLFASKTLTEFVSRHPTVVILCLSFLLMIGFSLIAEGVGFHIPKGYLYAAIGFSIVIEFFNQFASRNKAKYESQLPLRERTADAILRLMGGKSADAADQIESTQHSEVLQPFAQEERYMISGVLALGDRNIQTIMTPRNEISWVNIELSAVEIRRQLLDSPHNLFPVCKGSIDRVLGVVRAKDMLAILDNDPASLVSELKPLLAKHQPIFVSEIIDNLKLLNMLKKAKGNLAIVKDEYGQVTGLVSPLDLLEAIAGEFPDEDENPDISNMGTHWIVKGTASLEQLKLELDEPELFEEAEQFTVSGLLLYRFDNVPNVNDKIALEGYLFTVLEVQNSRILLVKIEKELAIA